MFAAGDINIFLQINILLILNLLISDMKPLQPDISLIHVPSCSFHEWRSFCKINPINLSE